MPVELWADMLEDSKGWDGTGSPRRLQATGANVSCRRIGGLARCERAGEVGERRRTQSWSHARERWEIRSSGVYHRQRWYHTFHG